VTESEATESEETANEVTESEETANEETANEVKIISLNNYLKILFIYFFSLLK